MFDSKRDEKALRKEGDRARDSRDWDVAAQNYRAYLAIKPNDAPIWIQLGHSLKEQGAHSDAEAAYRKALSITPKDADGYLQLGHVLKLQNRQMEAIDAYRHSYGLVPSPAAEGELVSLGQIIPNNSNALVNSVVSNATSSAGSSSNVVYFEVDDLLGFLRAHKTLSGIQRVQAGIISSVLIRNDDPATVRYAFVRTWLNRPGYWQIRPADLDAVVAYATSAHVEQSTLIAMIDVAERNAVPVKPAPGSVYFVMGAFWGFNGETSKYVSLKAAGVVVGVYVYDLIPISHPEYCDAHLVSDFALCFGDGFAVFDFVLAISDYTAQEVIKLQKRQNLRPVPVQTVRLAHVLKGDVAPPGEAVWTSKIEALEGRSFVMLVSTIEARKNHAYLVAAWKAFLEEGLDPPDLVFVGRFGWRVNDFMDQLEAGHYLGGRIHVLHDVSDGELETLYRSCLFTAFPSFVEGWGLPVGESLAFGCPCVASGTTSVPEVGGDLVDYLDPYNLRGGIEVLRKMAFDPAYCARRRQQIAAEFKPRNWTQVADELVGKIAVLKKVEKREEFVPLLKAGELFVPNQLRVGNKIPSNYPSRPLRLALSASWYAIEQFGVWMGYPRGRIRFRTEYAENTEIVAFFSMNGAPWASNNKIAVKIGSGSERNSAAEFPASVMTGDSDISVVPNRAFMFRVMGKVGAEGIADITITVSGDREIPEPEKRVFFVGLIRMAYCATSDANMRATIGETFLLETVRN